MAATPESGWWTVGPQDGYGWCIYVAYISLQAYFNTQSVSDTESHHSLNLRPMIP